MSKITRIHVNQHHIKANKRYADAAKIGWYGDKPPFEPRPDDLPVITVKDYKQNRKGMRAVIGDGVATIVYSPDKPLPCGATVWIETREEVTVSD